MQLLSQWGKSWQAHKGKHRAQKGLFSLSDMNRWDVSRRILIEALASVTCQWKAVRQIWALLVAGGNRKTPSWYIATKCTCLINLIYVLGLCFSHTNSFCPNEIKLWGKDSSVTGEDELKVKREHQTSSQRTQEPTNRTSRTNTETVGLIKYMELCRFPM